MSDQLAKEKDTKRWLIWLAIGVLLALIGPTWLYNRHFNPTEDVIFEQDSRPDSSPTGTPAAELRPIDD